MLDPLYHSDMLIWTTGDFCFSSMYEGKQREELQHLGAPEVLEYGSKRWLDFVEEYNPVLHARVAGYGYLSLEFGDEARPLKVLRSAAGYYLGTTTAQGEPNTRESVKYWPTSEQAEEAMDSGDWSQRMHL